MSKYLQKRVDALEGERTYANLSEILDHVVDGSPLPEGKQVHPALIRALDLLPSK